MTDKELEALEQLSPQERARLEDEARADVQRITLELRLHAGPRYARLTVIRSLIQLCGELMLEAQVDEGDEARPKIDALIDHLLLLVAQSCPQARTH